MAPINLNVVDLYHLDNVTSFTDAAAAGVWGVIHKATTGATGKDSEYANRRAPAIAAGLLWGAYHWGTNADVESQVQNFLTIAQPDAQTLVALDFEQTEGNQMTLDQARQFLTLIEEKLGRKAVLYSGSLIKDDLGSTKDAFFSGHRLWLAQYGSRPSVQASWSAYWLWQYADGKDGLQPNQVNGIPGDSQGNLDCNTYLGTKEQLTAEWAT
jgi:GH25 family lysozyme M1 (1,4-beta-N-acetylmuramidase)